MREILPAGLSEQLARQLSPVATGLPDDTLIELLHCWESLDSSPRIRRQISKKLGERYRHPEEWIGKLKLMPVTNKVAITRAVGEARRAGIDSITELKRLGQIGVRSRLHAKTADFIIETFQLQETTLEEFADVINRPL
jgi:hypothetical protein